MTEHQACTRHHMVNQKARNFEPEMFEDHYQTALIDLINQKRAGRPITPKDKPAVTNVINLIEALRGAWVRRPVSVRVAKPAKTSASQKEMLMPISGKNSAKEAATKKPSAKPQRKSA